MVKLGLYKLFKNDSFFTGHYEYYRIDDLTSKKEDIFVLITSNYKFPFFLFIGNSWKR